jgi:hypothetical protein
MDARVENAKCKMQNAKCEMRDARCEERGEMQPLTLFAMRQKDLSPRGRGISKDL